MADAGRNWDHLYVPQSAASEPFSRYAGPGGGGSKARDVDRAAHGAAINKDLKDSFDAGAEGRSALELSHDELAAQGTIIVLEGVDAAHPLKVDSLNSMTAHTKKPKKPRWLLLSVRPATDTEPERATVWVSDQYRAAFLQKFEDFRDGELTRSGKPKNRELVANISRIRQAVLLDLWTSDGDPPERGNHWWELWLDTSGGSAATFEGYAENYGLTFLRRSIRFRDRLVVWIEATWAQLQPLPFTAVPLAEIRRPEFIETIEDLPAPDQDEYVADLAQRTTAAGPDAPAVCHLDTGVLRTHVLLEHSLDPADLHTVIGTSGSDMHPSGHGTSMAGLALYGDLDDALQGSGPVVLRHRLESVRLMPGPGEKSNDQLDFGSATVQAVALPEITRDRRRVFALTLSTEPDNPGEPTLWSAAVDALAVGTESGRDGDEFQLVSEPDPEASRLIVVAAGNVETYMSDYADNSDLSPIEDPAQAWNALTVGAHTELTDAPQHPQYRGWTVLATSGELSPHSRTSLMFPHRNTPVKPDICMEGGNVLTDGAGMFEDKLPILSLRSTGAANNISVTSANATSAATAQAARLAALVMDRYPEYWPETVRGLLTHEAEWTPAMAKAVNDTSGRKKKLRQLRRFGWGVPTADAVLNSSNRAVTMVTQDQFIPFEGMEYSSRRFRLHTLPWPAEALTDLGEHNVRLRVTLSYFIEPSASRRGWRQKYAYASHSLRFDLQGALETRKEFIDRVNRNAEAQEDGRTGTGATTSARWLLGENQRTVGSLHQDEWTGSGAELSQCDSVAVYPIGGWWKNNKRRDRLDMPVRYALILSLTTDEQDVDLYTPIATQLRIPVETEITT
ncbi:S8 family peptidase [Tsukamurella tyrosinosolvens]|uniref:S8 family peptidase n=1 Tax=Tsukamurella tyrosinosolvens TaxID=57704 RepID=UPI002DD44E9B|nr:S8 family peptidase [Tsukamurella tyrosinosolvens]MEC4615513.1 S8 family peptidase [Tsukamurella tyrosinosolvens]